ncbi:hypothetical protein [Thalassotalea piscium]|uniref:STAS/SEC14 domain-containing protein n=1 Tax=Thalassotalea piscium TaxID=1230533 RepID=A0A7X0NER0_9GAMM|nr:hypothetical protein [Thalassotalea piscium]MBB6542092.1 hypothetical protein [Thalassotalea piscium]
MDEHGHYTLSVQDNLILSRFFGAWNVEQIITYTNHVKEVAKAIASKPWARVVDLSDWEGGGVEVVQPLLLLQQWAEDNNCRQVVFISPPLIPKYMLEKYGDPYHDYKICNSVEEAISYLKSVL